MNDSNVIEFKQQKTNIFIEILKGFGTIALFFILSIIGSLIFNYDGDNYKIKSLCYLGIYAVMFIGLTLIYHKRLINDLKSFKKEYIRTAFINWILGSFVMISINIILINFLGRNPATQEANESQLLAYPLVSILYMVLMGPLVEELTFRASFKKAFNKWYTFAIFTGLIFGLAHISSFEITEFLFVLSYGSLGFFFAKAYYETNNIFTSYLMHMFQNIVGITLIFIERLL